MHKYTEAQTSHVERHCQPQPQEAGAGGGKKERGRRLRHTLAGDKTDKKEGGESLPAWGTTRRP
jgi:hypothetical protein